MRTRVAHSLKLLPLAFSLILVGCEKRVDDAMLTARVKTQMTAEGRVSPTRVNVDTLNGVVTLKGEVPTQEEKDAAERAARKVEGVVRVDNQLVVTPAAAGTGIPSGKEVVDKARDAAGNIAQEVKTEAGAVALVSLIKTRLLAAGYPGIDVDVRRGEATLKGAVATDKDRTAVEAIVGKVKGVNRVNNQLVVKSK
jgi:hyperosmotically inducible periplasmic protein